MDKKSAWWGFGRSQGLNDTYKDKIAINTIIKSIDSIKIESVKAGSGIYSGLYITGSDFNTIKHIIKQNEFLEYLKKLNKCKNNGYFTFSSSDLAKYLNYKLGGNYE